MITLIWGLATHFAMAQEVCANATAAPWWWGSVQVPLIQQSDGSITGVINVPPGTTCSQNMTYELEGSYSNGGFSLTGAPPLNAIVPTGCASSITISGSLEKPGCDQANVLWTNSLGSLGGATWTAAAVIPTESSVKTNQWVLPSQQVIKQDQQNYATTIGEFEQTLTTGVSGSYNFGGRTINETFPYSNGDTCHFSRSKFDYFTPTAAPGFVMDIQDNNQYKDDVGVGGALINYYRYWHQAPCQFTTTQVMTISTASGATGYTNNAISITIDDATITSARTSSPTASQTETWGESQTQYAKSRTIAQIMQIWLYTHGL
ncbi:MAG TPA: hypothetical protein VGR92_03785 [Steroidobacteraceae bacterium]|nr:hypothetical protein [Steroidobacteraceae bacterium]